MQKLSIHDTIIELYNLSPKARVPSFVSPTRRGSDQPIAAEWLCRTVWFGLGKECFAFSCLRMKGVEDGKMGRAGEPQDVYVCIPATSKACSLSTPGKIRGAYVYGFVYLRGPGPLKRCFVVGTKEKHNASHCGNRPIVVVGTDHRWRGSSLLFRSLSGA